MHNEKKFFKEHQKVPVIEYQNNTSKKPLVSVCVQTYQHEGYIAECLDGILMQKTNFDFEVLVGEDDSSDGTRKICIDYANRFPDKIKLFLHSRENNIEIYGRPSAHFNFKYNMYLSKGKYIAICEGDDYWIDPLKLQKQIDFLEANKDYGMVFSDINMIDDQSKIIGPTIFYNKTKSSYQSGAIFWELLEGNFVQTLTVCLKKDLISDYLNKFSYEKYTYDFRIWLHVASNSKIKFIDEVWASYRVHDLGISRSKDFFKKRTPLVLQSALVNYLSIINYNSNLIVKSTFSKVIYNILKNANLTIEEKKPIIRLLKNHPIYLTYLLKYLMKRLLKRLK